MAITFKERPASYMRGRRVNAEEWTGISRSLEGSTALPFGVPAIAGSADRGCLPLTAANQVVLGVAEVNHVLPHPGDEYQQYDTVAICESGVIGVVVGANVTKGAQARFNTANGTWTGAAASATVLTIPGATFDEAGSNGNVVPLRYRRPNPSVATGA